MFIPYKLLVGIKIDLLAFLGWSIGSMLIFNGSKIHLLVFILVLLSRHYLSPLKINKKLLDIKINWNISLWMPIDVPNLGIRSISKYYIYYIKVFLSYGNFSDFEGFKKST